MRGEMVEEVRITVAYDGATKMLSDISDLLILLGIAPNVNSETLSHHGRCLIRISFSEHLQCQNFSDELTHKLIDHSIMEMRA